MAGRVVMAALAALVLASCGRADERYASDAGPGAPTSGMVRPPAYEADRSLDAPEVARAWVAALDRRDGARLCGLLAPWVAGRLDAAAADPDGMLGRVGGCPKLLSAFIGYVEDCCPPEFRGARVAAIDGVTRSGSLARVALRVVVDLDEQGRRRTEAIDDRGCARRRPGRRPRGRQPPGAGRDAAAGGRGPARGARGRGRAAGLRAVHARRPGSSPAGAHVQPPRQPRRDRLHPDAHRRPARGWPRPRHERRDEQRHPIPIPAQVAADGSVVSMVLDAAAFAAGRPSPMSGRERPRGRFAFTGYALARTGERDSVRDDLGTSGYPDGARLGA